MKKRYHLMICDDAGTTLIDEWCFTVNAIARLQEVITKLRRPELPQRIDPSFGQFQAPITGPSSEEVREFINGAAHAA